jgi:hypothetical protein
MARSDTLSAAGNLLKDRNGKTVAIISPELESERVSGYAHLFSAAPELLDFLVNAVPLALEENERMRPKPTLTGYQGFSHPLVSPGLPGWVDRAVQAMAVVYDEAPPQRDPIDPGLSLSLDDPNALEDGDGHVVVRVSADLDKATAREYVCLFLAAGEMLDIVDDMTKTAFKRHVDGQEVETRYKYIIPERLRSMSDLVAKAKGAVPFAGG